MDKEDIYCYFLVEAILNTKPNILYLYDKDNNVLFRIKEINNIWIPAFYNENIKTELYLRQEKEVYNLIDKFIQKSPSIYELERINDSKKQEFINYYIDSIVSKANQEELRKYLIYFSLRENEKIVGKILGDIFLGLDYSHKLWIFLEDTFKKLYYPLGINLESEVYL